MPGGNRPPIVMQPRVGYGGSFGRSYGAMWDSGDGWRYSHQWVREAKGSAARERSRQPSASAAARGKEKEKERERGSSPGPAAGAALKAGGGPPPPRKAEQILRGLRAQLTAMPGQQAPDSPAQAREGSWGPRSQREASPDLGSPRQPSPRQPSPRQHAAPRQWRSRGGGLAIGEAPRAGSPFRDFYSEEAQQPPMPKQPDRQAYEEAMDGIGRDIQELQAAFREVQQQIRDQKEYTAKKAELRTELDESTQRISKLQARKEKLLRSGASINWQEEEEHMHEEEEDEEDEPEEGFRSLEEVQEEIEEMEATMWQQPLTLPEEKRLLLELSDLYREASAAKDREKAREEAKAQKRSRGQILRAQVDEVNAEIHSAKAHKKAVAQEYQDLMDVRQREAKRVNSCLRRQELIQRRLDEKEEERTKLADEFKKQEQRYQNWLSRNRASPSAAPSAGVRARSRPPLAPRAGEEAIGARGGMHFAPPPRPGSYAGRAREYSPPPRSRSPQQRAPVPGASLREDSPEGDTMASIQRSRAVRLEWEQLEGEEEEMRQRLVALTFIIKFCQDVLRRKPPKPQAPRDNDDPVLAQPFEKCTKLPPKESRLQPGRDFRQDHHPSTAQKKSYQRARQVKQDQVNARSRSLEARLKQQPHLQDKPFEFRPPSTSHEELHGRGAAGRYIQKTFGGMRLVRHTVEGKHAFEDIGLEVPKLVEDVPEVLEQAEVLREAALARQEELEAKRVSLQSAKDERTKTRKVRKAVACVEEAFDMVLQAADELDQAHAEADEKGWEALAQLIPQPPQAAEYGGRLDPSWHPLTGRRNQGFSAQLQQNEGEDEASQARRAPHRAMYVGQSDPDRVDNLGRLRETADSRNRARSSDRGLRKQRQRRAQPTLTEHLKDCLEAARAMGISEDRLAQASDLLTLVERRAKEARMELAMEALREAREGGAAVPRERKLEAKAALRRAIDEAQAVDATPTLLVMAREALVAKVAVDARQIGSPNQLGGPSVPSPASLIDNNSPPLARSPGFSPPAARSPAEASSPLEVMMPAVRALAEGQEASEDLASPDEDDDDEDSIGRQLRVGHSEDDEEGYSSPQGFW